MRRLDFPSSAYLGLPVKHPNEFLYVNKVQSLSFPNDIYIHFALEKEKGNVAVFKKHAETLRSILKVFYIIRPWKSVFALKCFTSCSNLSNIQLNI